MCVYGGSLTLITAMDSIRRMRPTRSLRLVTILLIGVTGTIAAVLISEDFINSSLAMVLTLVGYFMAPWTSVNLTDFFIVRRGHYSVTEMFKHDGIYGLWNWRGITAYLGTLAIMVPFMNISDFTGPIAEALGGVDLAFFVGIPIGCLLYWLLTRGQDMEQERAVVAQSDRDLELIGSPIE
jgi:purine-cytosine permease-like protein